LLFERSPAQWQLELRLHATISPAFDVSLRRDLLHSDAL
jgi:hypothetical protein